MTTYGTIPTSSPGGSNLGYISRAKERLSSGLGARRPWKEMFNFRSINLPSSFRDAIGRIRTNLGYFRMNYVIVVLLILFLSLLWHPISLIVFIVMMAAWVFLYFLRDEPLVVFKRTIDDRVVMIVLSVLTLVFLFLTHATLNILVSLLIGVVVVVIHAALRKTDDLFLDEEAATGTGPMQPRASFLNRANELYSEAGD
ncbi:hypothetical protein F0562_022850 [Nyssa sinensis]|uniref:PRA1 family protein n=1 Tax=Nyssa sinensis TaxID=561372 RepID=A0A5J5BGF4_9ASTE|nr:hypothetical protein F0562_022850 [Nyssa sinensis]